jgi:citrate synthase
MATGGLDGVVVAETRLSRVDGEAGRLVVCGRDLEALAGRASFEAVCALLWGAGAGGEAEVRAALGRGRAAAHRRLADLGGALDAADGMEALRAAAAHLGGEAAEDAAAIAGALAVFAAAWARRAVGLAPVAPDPALPHAADFLRMLRGAPADAVRVRALDTYFVVVAEHGMNASTFTARVVASTGADAASAVVAALGALKGPLHGGAPGPVLDMLDAIGAPERAEAWLEAELAAGRRIMGLGHRVYRVRDPRAAVLEAELEALRAAGADGGRLPLARAVERAAVEVLRRRHPGRSLETNVEFYTAVLLDAIGLPRGLFTPAFAVARVAGWLAHVAEQRESRRIIRPACRYVGPEPAGVAAAAS